jgi:hypothetical protein
MKRSLIRTSIGFASILLALTASACGDDDGDSNDAGTGGSTDSAGSGGSGGSGGGEPPGLANTSGEVCEGAAHAPGTAASVGFEPCDDICTNAFCVPNALAGDAADGLQTCPDGASKCIPDFLIDTMGAVRFKTCESVGGAEGRCVKDCLAGSDVDNLEQADCDSGELCAPCYNPLTG